MEVRAVREGDLMAANRTNATGTEHHRRRVAFFQHSRMFRWAPPDTPCQGIKWGTVALRDIFDMHGRPARGFKDSSRCKRRAQMIYTRSDGTEFAGCWTHLESGWKSMSGRTRDEHDRELARVTRAYNKWVKTYVS